MSGFVLNANDLAADRSLGVHGLPAAEAGLVRALLALLGSGDTAWRWRFVTSGPCDVLLADAATAAAQEVQSERRARALLLLGTDAGPGGDALRRPLRANELEAALRRLAPQLGPAAPGPDHAPAATAAASPDRLAQGRYKLLRWPPTALLRDEPKRIRMATQLSRRYLSVADLASLTNQDASHCIVFLQLLQGFRLLESEPAAALPAPPPAAPEGGWALVRSIRRKLGL